MRYHFFDPFRCHTRRETIEFLLIRSKMRVIERVVLFTDERTNGETNKWAKGCEEKGDHDRSYRTREQSCREREKKKKRKERKEEGSMYISTLMSLTNY